MRRPDLRDGELTREDHFVIPLCLRILSCRN
jgi:hypothetical protein